MDYRVPDKLEEDLYVITPIFNAPRYKARWKHYYRFADYVLASGAKLVTIEAAFGNRTYAIPEDLTFSDGDRRVNIRVRTTHEMWIKENLINIALPRLPEGWKKVAWVDADVMFGRQNWVGETLHALEHYDFVQMFSEAQDLDPENRPLGGPRPGFVSGMLSGTYRLPDDNNYYGRRGATGLAWAATRRAINAVGRLMDFCVLGSADWHMAHALFGVGQKSYPVGLHAEYRLRIAQWQELADRHIRQNVGFVPGLILHQWHGKKVNRKYAERWKVLVDGQFQPSIDLKPDWQGVYQLEDHGTERSVVLRDGFRKYFRERNEDSIDV